MRDSNSGSGMSLSLPTRVAWADTKTVWEPYRSCTDTLPLDHNRDRKNENLKKNWKFLVLHTSKFMFQKPFPDFEIWNPSLKTFLIMTLMALHVHICMKYSINLLLLSIAWLMAFTSEDMISLAYEMKLFRRWWAIYNFFIRPKFQPRTHTHHFLI